MNLLVFNNCGSLLKLLVRGPVEIDVLVRVIAYLREIQDAQIESLDDPSPTKWDAYFVSSTRSHESHFEANELLARLSQAVLQLRAEQRDAFALSFEDEAGEDCSRWCERKL